LTVKGFVDLSIIDCRLESTPRAIIAPRGNEYHRALRAMLPALRRIVGPAMKADDGRTWRAGGNVSAVTARMYELAAAQALAVFAGDTGEAEFDLRDQIRSTLVRWQLSLLGDGRPAHRASLSVGHRAAAADFVARILAGGVSYETPIIVTDLVRHLRWLWEQRELSVWSQAALIDAACETALVARESGLLRQAREKLRDVLRRQNEAGWFEDGRACAWAEQAFTLDALARVYSQTGWPEMEGALRRALSFASPFAAAPRGAIFPMSALPFYAAESSAAWSETALAVGACGREAAVTLPAGPAATMHREFDVSLAASSMSLAAAIASGELESPPGVGQGPVSSCDWAVLHRHEQYDAWFDADAGAALVVRWRNLDAAFEDDLSIFTHGSVGRSVRTRITLQPSAHSIRLIYHGEVHRGERSLLREANRATTFLRRLRSLPSLGAHEREIVFAGAQITIRDRIALRRRADAVVFGSVDAVEPGPHPTVLGSVKEAELTRSYRQGRLVESRRNTR
jgi:hypothetical protein